MSNRTPGRQGRLVTNPPSDEHLAPTVISGGSKRSAEIGSFVGRTVADVRIERLLGRGGMAEVYLGHHLRLNRAVAIKILYAHLRDDPTLMQLLQAEAAALTAMRHPNIVHCVDCNVVQGRPYIVMELLDGITLKARLDHLTGQGLVPPLHVVERIIHSAAAALDHAHAQGIIHRDLKPANMMLMGAGGPLDSSLPLPRDVHVVLTDFGVARLLDATDRRDIIVGTLAYMSPEQASGGEVDARSDIYSLGVILYQMLVGGVPFNPQGSPIHSVVMRRLDSLPPDLPNTPLPLRQVVDRALDQRPESRYRRAGELAKAFERAVARGG